MSQLFHPSNVPVWSRKVTDQTLTVNAGAARNFLPPAGASHGVFSVISQGDERLYLSSDNVFGTGIHGVAVGGTEGPARLTVRFPPSQLAVGDLAGINDNVGNVIMGIHYFYDG